MRHFILCNLACITALAVSRSGNAQTSSPGVTLEPESRTVARQEMVKRYFDVYAGPEKKLQLVTNGKAKTTDSFQVIFHVAEFCKANNIGQPSTSASQRTNKDLDAGAAFGQGLLETSRAAESAKYITSYANMEPLALIIPGVMKILSEGIAPLVAPPTASGPAIKDFHAEAANLQSSVMKVAFNVQAEQVTLGKTTFYSVTKGLAQDATLTSLFALLTVRAQKELDDVTHELVAEAVPDVKVNATLIVLRNSDTARIPGANPADIFSPNSKAKFATLWAKYEAHKKLSEDATKEASRLGDLLKELMPEIKVEVGKALKELEGQTGIDDLARAYNEAVKVVDEVYGQYKDLTGEALATQMLTNGGTDIARVKAAISAVETAVKVFSDGSAPEELKERIQATFGKISNLVESKSKVILLVKTLYDMFNDLMPKYEEIGRVLKSVTVKADVATVSIPFAQVDHKIGENELRAEDRLLFSATAAPVGTEASISGGPEATVMVYPAHGYFVNTAGIMAGVYQDGKVKPGVFAQTAWHFSSAAKPEQFGLALHYAQLQLKDSDSTGTALGLGFSLFRDTLSLGIGQNFSINKRYIFIGLRQRV